MDVPQDRLVTACFRGECDTIAAALRDGATLNDRGSTLTESPCCLPLAAAVAGNHDAAVAQLLALGASANGEWVMQRAISSECKLSILRQLLEHGGDVTVPRGSGLGNPLHLVLSSRDDAVARLGVLLLLHPALDLDAVDDTEVFDPASAEEVALRNGLPEAAAMITNEVRHGRPAADPKPRNVRTALNCPQLHPPPWFSPSASSEEVSVPMGGSAQCMAGCCRHPVADARPSGGLEREAGASSSAVNAHCHHRSRIHDHSRVGLVFGCCGWL